VLDGIKDYMKDIPHTTPSSSGWPNPKRPFSRRGSLPPGSLQPEADLRLRRGAGPPRGRQRTHGIQTGLRTRDLHRPGSKSTDFWWASSATARAGWGKGYPEYADYPGIGGKLYRQGLIKMNEFVTLCGRDRVPIIWFQDTSGIDVGDIAEKAELLGLGQSLIYSIQADRRPPAAGGAAQRHCRGPLCHGRPHGQPAQCLDPGRTHHGNLRDARRDGRRRQFFTTPGQGEGCRQTSAAGHRQDEPDGPGVPR
jgi:hypothetical protein